MLDSLQWPAFLASLIAAWLLASSAKRRRNIGFSSESFLLSHLLWSAWGWQMRPWALVTPLNIRGPRKSEPQ